MPPVARKPMEGGPTTEIVQHGQGAKTWSLVPKIGAMHCWEEYYFAYSISSRKQTYAVIYTRPFRKF